MTAKPRGRAAFSWTDWRHRLPLLLKTIAIGAAGGALFTWLHTPLPWMLGALCFTSLAALGGAKLFLPPDLRRVMMAVLGVLLGSAFSPDLMEQVGQWPWTLLGMLVFVLLGGGLATLFLMRFGKMDGPTAFFSAAPGGLSEMILIAPTMGADERQVALIHATRIVMVMLILPPAFRIFSGYVPPEDLGSGGSILGLALWDLFLLTLCAVVGVVVGRRLRFPAWQMTGPMLASAIVHVTGLTSARPPYEILAVAQVIIGAGAGARFSGIPWSALARPMMLSAITTAGLVALAFVFALVLGEVTGLDFRGILLAYAPGGFAEMNLIALSLGIEVAFVAIHHTCRIFLVVMLATWLSQFFWKRPARAAPD
ncbi:MAG: AbrB family transcriptional regulator [Alphaproteobacteria bacterium]